MKNEKDVVLKAEKNRFIYLISFAVRDPEPCIRFFSKTRISVNDFNTDYCSNRNVVNVPNPSFLGRREHGVDGGS